MSACSSTQIPAGQPWRDLEAAAEAEEAHVRSLHRRDPAVVTARPKQWPIHGRREEGNHPPSENRAPGPLSLFVGANSFARFLLRINLLTCAQDGGKPVHRRCSDCAARDSALIFQCFWH